MQKGRGGCESWVNITLHVSFGAVDFGHPRLPTNPKRANSTSLTWKLLWSFQLKPTLTRQFISHCDIDFSNNHFISGRWSIPRTRPWRSLDRSSWRRLQLLLSKSPRPCPREMKWLLEKSLSRPWSECDLDSAHIFFVGVTVSSKLTDWHRLGSCVPNTGKLASKCHVLLSCSIGTQVQSSGVAYWRLPKQH